MFIGCSFVLTIAKYHHSNCSYHITSAVCGKTPPDFVETEDKESKSHIV